MTTKAITSIIAMCTIASLVSAQTLFYEATANGSTFEKTAGTKSFTVNLSGNTCSDSAVTISPTNGLKITGVTDLVPNANNGTTINMWVSSVDTNKNGNLIVVNNDDNVGMRLNLTNGTFRGVWFTGNYGTDSTIKMPNDGGRFLLTMVYNSTDGTVFYCNGVQVWANTGLKSTGTAITQFIFGSFSSLTTQTQEGMKIHKIQIYQGKRVPTPATYTWTGGGSANNVSYNTNWRPDYGASPAWQTAWLYSNGARFAGTTPLNEAAIDFSTMSIGALIVESTATATALRRNATARDFYFKGGNTADSFPYRFTAGRTGLQIAKDFNLGTSSFRFTSISLYADVEINVAATKTLTIYNSANIQSDSSTLRTIYLLGGGTLTANGATAFGNTAWNVSEGSTFNLASSGLASALTRPVTLNNGTFALGGKSFSGTLTVADNSTITATLGTQVAPSSLTIEMTKTLTTPGFSTAGSILLTTSGTPDLNRVYTNILSTAALDSGLPAKVTAFPTPEWRARLSSDSLALEIYADTTTRPFNLVWNGGPSGTWADMSWDNHGTTTNFADGDWTAITQATTVTVASAAAPARVTIDSSSGDAALTGAGSLSIASNLVLTAGTFSLDVETSVPVISGTGTVSIATNKTFSVTSASPQAVNAGLSGEGTIDFTGAATFNSPFVLNGTLELGGAGTFKAPGGSDTIAVETLSMGSYALTNSGWGWLKLTGIGSQWGDLFIASGAVEFASGSSSTFAVFTNAAYGSNVLRVNGHVTMDTFLGTAVGTLPSPAEYEINEGASVLIKSQLILHNQNASTTETQQKSIWKQSGGRVTVGGTTYLGRDGKALLNLSGGTFITPKLVLGANAGWNATDGSKRSEVNLTGGTLVLGSGGLLGSDTGYTGNNQRKLYFGGTLASSADTSLIAIDGSQVTISMTNATTFNTAKFDTNTFAYTTSPVTITVSNAIPATASGLSITGPGTAYLKQTSAFGDLAIDTGSTLKIDMTIASAAITLASATNAGTVAVAWTGPFTEKTVYTIMTATTAPGNWGTVDLSSITALLGEGQSVARVDSEPTKLQFMVTGNAAELAWNSGVGGIWAHGNAGWLDLTGATATYANGDLVSFTNLSGSATETVTIDNVGVTPGSLTITNSTTEYAFTGGTIAGTSIVITKDGEGTAAFNSANTYSGTTTIKGGALIYGTEGAFGSSSLAFAGGTLGVAVDYNATNTAISGTSNYSFTIANATVLTLTHSQLNATPCTITRLGTTGTGTASVPVTTAKTLDKAIMLGTGAKLSVENTLNANPATTLSSGVLTNGSGQLELKSTVASGTAMRNQVYGNNTGFSGELILSGIWSRSLFLPTTGVYHDTRFDTFQSFGSGVVTLNGQGFWVATVNNEANRLIARLNVQGETYLNGASGNWYWFNGLSGSGTFSTWLGNGGAIFTGDCSGFGGTLYSSGITHTWQFGGGSYLTPSLTPSGTLFTEGATLTNSVMKILYTSVATNNMAIHGGASVVYDGTASGKLTFNKSNTYSGTTTLTSGKLVGASATPFGTGALTVSASAALEATQDMTVGNLTVNGTLDLTVSNPTTAPTITANNVTLGATSKVSLRGNYPSITVGKYVTVLKATGTAPSLLPQLVDEADQPITSVWLEWVGNELRVKSRGTMILFM